MAKAHMAYMQAINRNPLNFNMWCWLYNCYKSWLFVLTGGPTDPMIPCGPIGPGGPCKINITYIYFLYIAVIERNRNQKDICIKAK